MTFYLQNGLGFSPLVPGLAFLPLRMGFLISSLLTPKVVPKLEVGILKIGAFITIICYVFLILTVDQEVNTGLQWSQLLPFMFALAVGNGFILIPLINAILSHAKIEDAGAASGLLNTMIAVGNAMGIAFIGSIFLGLIGIGCGAASAIRIHYYSDALIN